MRTVIKVSLLGRVGTEPEMIGYDGGKIAKFSLATNEGYKDKNDEWQEKTSWHRLISFGKTSETVEKHVKKGDLLYIDGTIVYDSYENKEGVKVYTTDIKIFNLVMLGGGKKTDDGESHQEVAPPPKAKIPAEHGEDESKDEDKDDLPF